MSCIFCRKEQIATDIIYEDEAVMAFMDINPINTGHVLLIPKEHYLDVDELPDELLCHLMIISKRIVSALRRVFKADGYSIIQNGGSFNDIGHYHLHIFPRHFGDGFGWTSGAEQAEVSHEIAEQIKRAL